MKSGSYLHNVKDHYENYPYPARDPAQEKKNLFVSKSCSLDCINHYCFGGTKIFDQNFRVLIAGGGTGDDTIYLAEQLRESGAEIVYLDMTEASMNIAKARAEARGLSNIHWHQDSLLNLNSENYGEFDFIACTGVLHHLENPDDGLASLKRVLKSDGAMYIMVYATIGRTGVYQMQDLMRRINHDANDMQQAVNNTKNILAGLPSCNWFQFNKKACEADLSSDIGIYDLLLHSQDRSYSVDEFYDFIEGQGLTLDKLYNPDLSLGDFVFRPETFIRSPQVLSSVTRLPTRKQQAICEILFGQIMKQCGFVSHNRAVTASTENLELAPAISTISSVKDQDLQLRKQVIGTTSDISLNGVLTLKRTPCTAEIFAAIDGKTSLRDIAKSLVDHNLSPNEESAIKETRELVDTLISLDLVYLKTPESPLPQRVSEMIKRVRK